jgi:predicted phage terminase large subunit-like protein
MMLTDLRLRPPDNATLVAAILGTDLYSFVQASFPIVSGGGRFLPNWHVESICYELSQVIKGLTRRLIITVPPRSLKSICASVCLPAFILGHDPARRIICVSYSEGLARKHANDCRALMRSNLYRGVFPATRISAAKDTETEVMTTARGSRLATSVGGTLTGRGGNLVIIDDPLKQQEAQSQSARDSLKQWYSNTLLSRLDHKTEGSIIVVMQRLHPDDLVGHLLEQQGWRHLNLPAIAEEETIIRLSPTRSFRRRIGGLLHPERESQMAFDELKTSMGSMEFSAQYQQAPVPAGGNLIKWSWFRFYDQPPTPLPDDKVIISWDTALSSSQLADYSACVVLLVRHQSIYILDVIRARLEYPDLKRTVLENYDRWNQIASSCVLVIEEKGSGLSLIQDLRRDDIHAIGIAPEGDKIMRMAAQTAVIEAGAVHLPTQAHWLEEFKKELLSFPASKHDDQIDALSQALQRASTPDRPTATFGTFHTAR